MGMPTTFKSHNKSQRTEWSSLGLEKNCASLRYNYSLDSSQHGAALICHTAEICHAQQFIYLARKTTQFSKLPNSLNAAALKPLVTV